MKFFSTRHESRNQASAGHWLKAVLAATAFFLPLISRAQFTESGNLVVMAAVHYQTNVPASGHAWIATNYPPGFASPADMFASPHAGVTFGSVAGSPELTYPILLTNSGAFRLWARGFGLTKSSDSIYVAVDSKSPQSLSFSPVGAWAWKSVSVNLTNAGQHTVNVWMRGDGCYLDRLLLAQTSYTPAGSGPPESGQGGITPAIQLTSPEDGTSYAAGVTVQVTADVFGTDVVTAVKFYVNGTLAATSTNAPFGFAWTPAVGSYQLSAVAAGNAGTIGSSSTVSVTINPSAAGGGGAFVESGGWVVIEAEHFRTNTAASGHAWVATNNVPGFVGTAAMAALPNIGTTISSSIPTTSPGLTYLAELAHTGSYKFWIRGYAPASSDNSVYVGVDNQTPQTLTFGQSGVWGWQSATVNLTNTGLHQIHIWMRRDGFYVDRLLLTAIAAYVPSGTGPAESSQISPVDLSPSVQITSPVPGASFVAGSTVQVSATASDPDGAIANVSFLINGVAAVTFTNAPYTFDWMPTVGSYQISAIATDNAGESATNPPVAVTVTPPVKSNGGEGSSGHRIGGFNESGNLVVMEAEHFQTNTAASNHAWVATTNVAGFAGTSAMQALPHIGTTISSGIQSNSPALAYIIQTTNAGAAKLWVRGFATNGSDDSIYVGVDQLAPKTVTFSQRNAWVWSSASFTFTNAGPHVIHAWMRQDGAYVDRLVLSLNSVFVPTGQGPTEIAVPAFDAQIISPAGNSSFVAGDMIRVSAGVSGANPIAAVDFYVNGALAAAVTNSPYSFSWAPAAGNYALLAVAEDSLGNSVTSAPVNITVISPPAATFRYAASSGNIYVEGGGVATLTDIAVALPHAPLHLIDPLNRVWFLGANLIVDHGSTLLLHGSGDGGDVDELRLKSDNVAGGTNNYVWVNADWGTLDLNGVRVISWDEVAGGPDTEYGIYQRAFVRAQSRLVGTNVQQSTLNVVNSEIGWLGFDSIDGYGLNWEVVSSPPGVTVFGAVYNSYIHDCQLDVSSWSSNDVAWAGNEIASNTLYGFNASDPNQQTVMAGSSVHDNGFGATFRWANTDNRIYLTGPGDATLSDIANALPHAPLSVVDPTNLIWYLAANLYVINGAHLKIYGPNIGGDVGQLRVMSDRATGTNGIIELRADPGWLDIQDTRITSWNNAVNGPDIITNIYLQPRSYIHARSTLDPDGHTVHESRMDIINSDIGYLGYHATEAYGLSWKVVDTTAKFIPSGSTNTLYDLVRVYGDVFDSHIHNNAFGIYTYGDYGGRWADNEIDHNLAYGVDPHNHSDFLDIENNNVHHNGWHGIIASVVCVNGVMRNNLSWNNGLDLSQGRGTGIFLHRSCNNWLIENNESFNNRDSGMALFAVNGNLIRNNFCVSNGNAGIRLSVGSADNTVSDNEIDFSGGNGLFLFPGTNLAYSAYENETIHSGQYYITVGTNRFVADEPTTRCEDNVFSNNLVYGFGLTGTNLEPIKVDNGDGNVFIGNAIVDQRGLTNTLLRFLSGTNNLIIGNFMPSNTVVAMEGSITNGLRRSDLTTFMDQPRLNLQLGTNSTATFADENGAVFDLATNIVVLGSNHVVTVNLTTVANTTGSYAILAPAQIGSHVSTILTRNFFVTPATGTVLVNPTLWNQGSPNYNKAWKAQASSGSLKVGYLVGDLQPGQSYRVFRGPTLLATQVASAGGYISFVTTPGNTSLLSYSVTH